MKKHDGVIDEDAINDLIKYAEEDAGDIPDMPHDILHTEQIKTDSSADNPPYKERAGNTYGEGTREPENIGEYKPSVGKSKKEKPYAKKSVVIGLLTGLAAVLLFIGIDSGAIGKYKENFLNNFSGIFANFKSEKSEEPAETVKPDIKYITEISKSAVLSFEGANETRFAAYRGGIIAAKMNYMSYTDASGEIIWEIDTAIVSPILKAEGNYILLAEKGGNKLCLYSDRKLLYDVDDPDTIVSAELSGNGDAVLVTDKSSYKGGISVYNKNGAQVYSWSSGYSAVLCADISPSSRSVAAALLNTEDAVKSTLLLFDLNQTESYASTEFDDTVIYNVQFTGDIVTVFGDNRLAGVSAGGKLIYDNIFDSAQLTHSACDEKGNTALSLNEEIVPMINVYKKRGGLTGSTVLSGTAEFIDVNGKNIIYNIGRDIYFGPVSSKQIRKYTAAMDIKKLIILSDDAFAAVYSNSLEFVEW